jgi:hypothetical protein
MKHKNPNAPKKQTAYMIFCKKNMMWIKAAGFLDVERSLVMAALAQAWKSTNQEPYKKLAAISKYKNKRGNTFKGDPHKPKKTSGWILFCKYNKESVKTKNPEMSGKERQAELSRLWKALSAYDKKPYETEAKVRNQNYMEKMKTYVKSDQQKELDERRKAQLLAKYYLNRGFV